jgi:hypothetical protein
MNSKAIPTSGTTAAPKEHGHFRSTFPSAADRLLRVRVQAGPASADRASGGTSI